MIKGSVFKKCLSLVMVFAILMSLAAPAAAAVEEKLGYFAMGDAATSGFGLDEEQKNRDEYFVKVADYLNCLDSYAARGEKGYRVEEIRYMLDNDYAGDEYTDAKMPTSGTLEAHNRAEWQDFATRAEVISVHAGVNNFSTYVVEQLMYYVENGGDIKYALDWEGLEDDVTDRNVVAAMDEVRDAVMDRLLAAAPDRGDQALEMIEFVSEVSIYAVVSYIVNFNGMVEAIYELNPDVELYIIGIYNPTSGNTLTYTKENGETITIPVDEVIGALVEIANAYSQILAPRAYNYTYVDPGDPELLIDQMGNTDLTNSERIPDGLLEWLMLEANVDSSVSSFVEEKLGDYELTKMEIDEIVDYVIYEAEDAADREAFIMEKLTEKVNEYALEKFDEELANVDTSVIGTITIDEEDIQNLLTKLDAAKVEGDDEATEAAREAIAEEFVVDLITQNMVGKTFAGIKIETQQDAYDAIDLLERNSNGDPAALREAAADMIMTKVGENGLREFITRADVLKLLEQLDSTTDTSEREVVIYNWMNDLAVKKITQKIQEVNPNYTEDDARALLAAMEADSANATVIAKNHMLTTGGFHAYMVDKFTQTYSDNGLTLQTYASFDAFVTAVENAPTDAKAKEIVRNEIKAAAALKVVEDDTCKLWMSSLTKNQVIGLFEALDSSANKNGYLESWLADNFSISTFDNSPWGQICVSIRDTFMSAYEAYNNAATAAENAFVTYRNGLDEASEAFAQYVELKDDAAAEILSAYESSYKGAGETALNVYNQYLTLKSAAVGKVLDNYATYEETLEKVMDSVRQLSGDFDHILNLLCEIATYHGVSINDLITVAKSLDAEYVKNMVSSISNADAEMAQQDKTVAYLALRYYLAEGMMIMPSGNGHTTISGQMIKALNGENTNSVGGNLANKVIDKGIDLYHIAKDYLKLPTTASGQVETLINPEIYVAFGDNIAAGDALSDSEKTYVEILSDALAMDYSCGGIHNIEVDGDVVVNSGVDFGTMRTEDLLWLLGDDSFADDYTYNKFGVTEEERAAYQQYVKDADLISVNVGIDNLITYPMTQTLLAYNGETPYDMAWENYFDETWVNRIEKGKNAAMKLVKGIIDTAENRIPGDDGVSAYSKCETALNTVATAVESLAYSLLGYVVNLDHSVETIAEINTDATIVLVGYYNPLEGTYVTTGKTFTVADKTIDLPDRTIDVSALADKVINLANRFLTNYIGDMKAGENAADEGSRVVTVDIKDAELGITDTGASKDLTTLTDWKTVSVKGHEITIKVPEYLLETVSSKGSALHPNANGHQYIADQILDALDYEIHADVTADNNSKVYGEIDPELTYTLDDESSLYDELVVTLDRVDGEDVGKYEIIVTVAGNDYYEVDTLNGTFEIVKRPATVTVTVDSNGVIQSVEFDAVETAKNVLDDDKADIEEGIVISGTTGAYAAECNADVAKNYDLTINVVEEEDEPVITGTITYDRWTMSLDSVVYLNYYMNLDGFEGLDLAENGGVVIWTGTTAPTCRYDLYVGAPNTMVLEGMYQNEDGEWYVKTHEIYAKNLGDLVYIRPYVEVAEDTYVYQEEVRFHSPAWYCYDMLSNMNEREDSRFVCAALLEYGASAQVYFDYKTDALVTTIPVEASKANPSSLENWANIELSDYDLSFNDSYLDELYVDDHIREISQTLTGTRDDSLIPYVKSTLDLQGAIKLSVGFDLNLDWNDVASAEVLFWTQDTCTEIDSMAYELHNYDFSCELTPATGEEEVYIGSYVAKSDHILAKNLSDTVYFSVHIVMNDGTVYRNGLRYYSPEQFVYDHLNDKTSGQVDTVCERIAVYSEMARIRFLENN